MFTIAVVSALDFEGHAWRRRHTFRRTRHRNPRVFEASLGGIHVRMAAAGIGACDFGALADDFFDGNPSLVLSIGLAGALDPGLEVGDVIAPRRIAQHSGCSGDARSTEPAISVSDSLLDLAWRAGARPTNTLVCTDRVLALAAHKKQLAPAGTAVDMESYRVLGEAARRGIPALALKVIGDAADEDLPFDADGAIAADGSVRHARLAYDVARHPFRWPALLAFGRRQQAALRALADVLDRFVDTVSRDRCEPESRVFPPGQPVLQRAERR